MLIEAGENLLLPAFVTALHFIDSALFKSNYYKKLVLVIITIVLYWAFYRYHLDLYC